MSTLITARLVGADLPAAHRTALEARFLWEIERLYGSERAAAISLHHFADGGIDLLETLTWNQAEKRVIALLTSDAGMPAGAAFSCDVTRAFFRSPLAGDSTEPLFAVAANGPSLSPEMCAQLQEVVRHQLVRQFGDEGAAADALHDQQDALEAGDEPLLWSEAAAVAERIALTEAGLQRGAARFTYAPNYGSAVASSTATLWPEPTEPAPF